jgi:hypothetical protein
MKRRVFLSLLILLGVISLTFPLTESFAKQCQGDTCIKVTTDDKSVVITVQKGKPGAKSATESKPKVTSTPKPKPKPKSKPKPSKPITKAPPKKSVPKIAPKPTKTKAPKKTAPTKPKTTKVKGTSLTDQVRKLLPGGAIQLQPITGILRGEPVNFMTSVPNRFQTTIVVLDVPIQLDLRANYLWDFGDGVFLPTMDRGAPYPAGLIRHSYRELGEKTVRLNVTWSGVWRAGTVSGPIQGVIRQFFQREFEVERADTDFTQ